MQWTDTKAALGNLITSLLENSKLIKADQKIYSLLIYDFIYKLIYDFFLSNNFRSSNITFNIFNNLTFFGTAEKNKEKVIINFDNTSGKNLIINFGNHVHVNRD